MSRVCTYCGTPANDAQVYCGRCGAALPQVQQPYQQQPYQQQPYQQQPYQQSYQPQPSQAQPPQKELGMKWFKFLIYFSLFAGAILNAINGVSLITGMYYESRNVDVEFLYKLLPDLKSLDMFYGASMIVIALLGIVARFQLSGFKKNGPTMYYAMLGLSILIETIYSFVAAGILEEWNANASTDFTSSVTASICISIAMLVCNITYFNKRKHLFVN